jgi:hypothetical protein
LRHSERDEHETWLVLHPHQRNPLAPWWLATGHEVACDECVPRGEDYDEGDSLDDLGRKFPGYKWRAFADQET